MSVVAVVAGFAAALAPAASAAGEGATITGTVTAADGGAALNGICVTAWRPPAQPDGDPTLLVKTTTGLDGQPDGQYTLSGVPAGAVEVEFDGTGECPGADPTNYVAQWWNNKETSALGDAFTVADLDTVPNIDAAMVLGGAISGTVTAKGAGIGGICVVARDGDDNDLPRASIGTNANGTYTLRGVPAGNVHVVVNEQVQGRLCPGGMSDLTLPAAEYTGLPVTASATTTAVDATLGFPISIDRNPIHEGGVAALSAAGVPPHGTVVFNAPGHANLCTITLPASNCTTSPSLALGTYGPITAQYTPTHTGYTGKTPTSTNTLSLTVDRNPVVPGAPTHVHAALGSGSSITVTWSAPADDGGSAITGYTVKGAGKTVSTSASTVNTTFSHVAAGSHAFTVQAANAIGSGPAAKSNTVTIVGATSTHVGYWMLGSDGKVYAFGDAKKFGNAPTPSVAIATRRDGKGYWVTDAAGRVSHFGSAAAHGGHPSLHNGERVSAISATPTGNGYWLFTNRGRAFAYGDAHFYGDMSGTHLNGPVIASAATATGHGYYMIGSDGGVFTFGDAKFRGSTGNMRLNKPVVGISPTPDGSGYWLVASDGGVFAFHAPFRGSAASLHLNKPVNGLVAFGNGYLMVASDGGVFDYSNQPFLGSLANATPTAPIIGIAAFTA